MTPPLRSYSDTDKNSSQSDEYFDLVDVVGFVWQSRKWIISGMITGLVVAGVILMAKDRPLIVTTIPMNLEEANRTSRDGMVGQFNLLIARADFLEFFFKHLGGPSPESVIIAGRLPFSLTQTGNRFELEISRRESDPSGATQLKLAQALRLASHDVNTKIAKEPSRPSQTLSYQEHNVSEIEIDLAKLFAQQTAEEAPHRAKLFALEQKLIEMNGKAPPVSNIKTFGVEENIVRLVGFLGAKIPNKDQVAVLNEYAEIIGSLKAIQLKYEPAVRELSTNLPMLTDKLIDRALGDLGNVPVFSVDEGGYKLEVLSHHHEKGENRNPFALAVGVLIGAVFGLSSFIIWSYLKQNLDRFKAVFRTPKGN